ncbi:uncharacterized protein LOC118395543 isoform X1 [Oncorhynchus keta]|uniref:uncharacterized protein LOC118395543 isoform X1 n=1 Tax=Oncorhynchus keta TaxID=8018 RepID=UPI0015F8DD84|nr:uncharacterized protein LOC118395543 isoform X1 [Oncorhynchus keta]
MLCSSDIWESNLCVHPTNPSAIRMILRRVGLPGSSQKAVWSPVLTQLSQSAVHHVEANASHDLPCPLTVELLKARNLYIPWLKDSPTVNQEVSQLKRPKLSCPKLTQLSQGAVQHVEAGAKASPVSSYLSWKRLKDFIAKQKKVSQPKRPKLVPSIRAPKDPSPLRQKQQRQRKRSADKVYGSRGCTRAAKKDISGDLAQLKPGQSTGDAWNNTDTGAEEPRRLEVMKNLTGLWGSTGQGQPQPTPRANRLSPSLAQYLASTVTPRTFDLQIMGMTSDLMDFLDMPEERLSIELWDLREGTGDQRYKANWQFSEEHGNVLMEGVWLQKDDNW